MYPWSDYVYRGDDLFKALIPSIKRCSDSEEIELSIIDTGTRDIYGRHRVHNHEKYEKRLYRSLPENEIIYTLSDCFEGNTWHLSKALDLAVRQSTADCLLLVGIDIILPPNLVDVYFDNVIDGEEVWVPHCYNILEGQLLAIPTHDNRKKYNGWRIARGILGIAKTDYFAIGGYPLDRVGFRVGVDAYLLKKCEENFQVNEDKCLGMFHLHHENSKVMLKGRLE
jgi:hypothetical protein